MRIAYSIALLLVLIMLAPWSTVQAQGNGIEPRGDLRIAPAGGGAPIQPPLVAPGSYVVEVEYQVTTDASDDLVFSTDCQPGRNGKYWDIGTYAGVSSAKTNPLDKDLVVSWKRGTIALTLFCTIPASTTTRTSLDEAGKTIELHNAKEAWPLLTLRAGTDPRPMAERSHYVEVTDTAILAYEAARDEAARRVAGLREQGSGWEGLAQKAADTLAGAEAFASSGRMDIATATAQAVPGPGDVDVPTVLWYQVSLGGLVVVGLIVLAVAASRGRRATTLEAMRERARLALEDLRRGARSTLPGAHFNAISPHIKDIEDALVDSS